MMTTENYIAWAKSLADEEYAGELKDLLNAIKR